MKTPIEQLLDQVAFKPIENCHPNHNDPVEDGHLPYATHHGVLKIGDLELDCFRLNTGQAVFAGKAIEDFLNGLPL